MPDFVDEQQELGRLWGRANNAVSRTFVRRMSLSYWFVLGWWLVPIVYLTLWGVFALAGTASVLRQLWHLSRPTLVRRGMLRPRPPRGAPIRLGREAHSTNSSYRLSRRELTAGPTSGPIQDWRTAEERAATWMRHWGWTDATVTPAGADGGIDVIASRAVAQVKFWAKPVPRQDLQKLVGAASTRQDIESVLFFANAGYTSQALRWAETAGIAIFNFDGDGVPQPQNSVAQQATRRGQGD